MKYRSLMLVILSMQYEFPNKNTNKNKHQPIQQNIRFFVCPCFVSQPKSRTVDGSEILHHFIGKKSSHYLQGLVVSRFLPSTNGGQISPGILPNRFGGWKSQRLPPCEVKVWIYCSMAPWHNGFKGPLEMRFFHHPFWGLEPWEERPHWTTEKQNMEETKIPTENFPTFQLTSQPKKPWRKKDISQVNLQRCFNPKLHQQKLKPFCVK